ncbi:MAG: 3-dehydroquinate synthase [Dehalococcoidales bacterium]|nr:3-dehydroquinate synthase [Dehalococcoidales bacterium]
MRKVKVRLASNSYEIRIGSGILSQLGYWLKENSFADKLVIITSPSLKRLYGDALEPNLTREGFKVITLLVPDGEEQKSLETAGKLYYELSNCHAERTTPILALGGGVIGDLAGFVAATYLRGVPLVQIPTTLLAQVDSSIGGKVALDHGRLKNKIGAFYQPRLVVTDIATLLTLPAEELSDGLAEVIKYAVIWDKGFFTYLEENLDRIRSLDSGALEAIVFKSAKIKGEIVEKDERDFGLRHILNYGHTLGHAIETASDFKVRHGQAVAIGMLAAGRISNKLNILSRDEQIRLKRLIQRTGLPTQIPNLNVDEIIQVMKHDKKILGGKIRFVLPKSIGKAFITDEVTPSLIEQVLVGGDGET